MADMVDVVIDSIRVSLMSQQRIVILREAGAERYLPIWIGVPEADAITLALQDVKVDRPLTWDLLKNVFGALNARVLQVEVVALRDNTFFGNIVVEVNGHRLDIDARPSDAIALAVRAQVPIRVARVVMDEAGIIPEEDIQDGQTSTSPPAQPEPEGEGGTERLSVFEDFLEKLDLDNMDQSEDDEEDKP